MSLGSKIRLSLFGTSVEETTVKRRGFRCDNPETIQHLENIGESFLTGYHGYLDKPNFIELKEGLEKVQIEYQGFAFEGAGMAIALLDWVNPFGQNKFKEFIIGPGSPHVYMAYVGAGWAYARLPVNPEKASLKMDPLLRWLVLDGYGFHQAYFKTKEYVDQIKIPKNLSPYALRAFHQGIGRALWFVEGSIPIQIANRIKTYPTQYHSDLWAGVGLAATYAGRVDSTTLIQLKDQSDSHILHLLQGVIFAAKARARAGNIFPHCELACQILLGCNIKKAIAISDRCEQNLSSGSELPSYEIWRSRIRDTVLELQVS